MCTTMLIVAVLAIVKYGRNWYHSMDKCIRKICHISGMYYIVEYYSAIKNKLLPFVTTWMVLCYMMLSEIRLRKTNAT